MLLALSCVAADLTREKLITGRGNLLPYSNMSDRSVSRSLSSIETAYLDLVEMAVTGSLFWEGGESHPDRTPQRPIQHDGCIVSQPRNLVSSFTVHRRLMGTDWPTVGHTMIGHLRLRHIRYCIDQVVAAGVAGDVAELGVWRGGATIYAKAVLRVLEERQNVNGPSNGTVLSPHG